MQGEENPIRLNSMPLRKWFWCRHGGKAGSGRISRWFESPDPDL